MQINHGFAVLSWLYSANLAEPATHACKQKPMLHKQLTISLTVNSDTDVKYCTPGSALNLMFPNTFYPAAAAIVNFDLLIQKSNHSSLSQNASMLYKFDEDPSIVNPLVKILCCAGITYGRTDGRTDASTRTGKKHNACVEPPAQVQSPFAERYLRQPLSDNLRHFLFSEALTLIVIGDDNYCCTDDVMHQWSSYVMGGGHYKF